MESCSADCNSFETSGSCLTDAATVVRRLFNNPLYSDLAVSVDEATFHVHRGILAEHCAYFRTMFDNARSRNPTTEIKQVDCTFKAVAVERARRVTTARAKGDHKKKVGDTSNRHEDDGRSGSTGDAGGQGDRRDMTANGGRNDIKGSMSKVPSLDKADSNANASSCQIKAQELGSTLPDRSSSQPSEESQASVSPSSLSKVSSKNLEEHTASGSVSAEEMFTAMFVNDERKRGYTSHHFALFLQQLYGILTPSELNLVDLLPVLRIAYLHGVPGLIAVLADLIFDSLRLSVDTWPATIRFAERYQLQDIHRRALEHASADKSLWRLAVEMLSLEDFKVFLRGVVCYSSDEPSLARQDYESRKGLDSVRKYSRDGHTSNSFRIRQQLLQPRPALTGTVSQTAPIRAAFNSKPLRLSDQVGQETLDLNLAAVGQPEQNVGTSVTDLASTDKADKAIAWMVELKRECGWDGRLSYLD
ncbi:hypothetical protein EC968_008214 [Mortierella alpina]|nr:hypothetical protein EC968_008214 [Mortierella alpina]